ncbi:MAG: hypothetical protein IID14_03635 [Candidatus Marinimicrobia bacterium]|nr:hypothetical protein [Candidatus Neomarinimicrobiota bacterium]
MPKSRNSIETVIIKISTTPMIEKHLKHLINTGLYGKNTAEAAERLVAESIKALIEEDFLSKLTDEGNGID